MSAAIRWLFLAALVFAASAYAAPRQLPAPADGGGGGGDFSTITAGTNAGEALTVGTGSVLAPDITTTGIVRANEAWFLQVFARPDDDSGYAGAAFSGVTITTTSATGASTGVVTGLSIDMDMEENSGAITDYNGILVETPEFEPTGTTLDALYGLRIQSLRGMGTVTDSILIEAQVCDAGCSSPERKGNIRLIGGNWNNGHFSFQSSGASGDHLWRDQINERLRISTDSVPTSETSGEIVLMSSSNANWGPMFWGVSDNGGAAIFDTGTEICALNGGLTCVRSGLMGSATDAGCGVAHSDTLSFWVFCQ